MVPGQRYPLSGADPGWQRDRVPAPPCFIALPTESRWVSDDVCVTAVQRIDYARLIEEHAVSRADWDRFVRGSLVDRWMADYRRMSGWPPRVLEIAQDDLTYLFDAAPTLVEQRRGQGDDRLVAVWGCSHAAARARDGARMAGFLPGRARWSAAKRDRGHFVAHAAGGGMDLNLFPQAAGLNRGSTAQGRRWRELERYAARHPGTPLFVRPIYDGASWVTAELDFAVLTETGLRYDRFANDT